MFNPFCLIIDTVLAISLAWNTFLDAFELGFLGIPTDAIGSMFDWFFFLCRITEAA